MSDTFDPRLEALAEAVAFAHASDIPGSEVELAAKPTTEQLALERTAALAMVALAPTVQMPKALQDRLAAAGLAFCAEQRRRRMAAVPPAVTPPAVTPIGSTAAYELSGPRSSRSVVGTLLISLAAGVALWFVLRGEPMVPSAADQRASLLAIDPKAVHVPWKPGPSPKSGTVSGEVVWSQERQEGFLTFKGLPPLDDDHRFQLWIVDGNREGAPVDGGVFGLADANAETVVPVQARLPIGKPAAFVVTVETKAGVVVSKQEHVVAIAGL
ncbi:MAG: anti-sigma factor [Planctomycetes bacterium]|nr:anti-sigma factor [Planctomycetota bacterium]